MGSRTLAGAPNPHLFLTIPPPWSPECFGAALAVLVVNCRSCMPLLSSDKPTMDDHNIVTADEFHRIPLGVMRTPCRTARPRATWHRRVPACTAQKSRPHSARNLEAATKVNQGLSRHWILVKRLYAGSPEECGIEQESNLGRKRFTKTGLFGCDDQIGGQVPLTEC